jgi:hypothetical protein
MARYRSPAMRRYVIRLAVLMTAYIVLLFGSNYLFRNGHPTGPTA